MASKNRKSKKSSAKQQAARRSGEAPRARKRKSFGWKGLAVVVALVSVSFAGLAAYRQNWQETHDLSAIGNGIPTIVQVHDPNCPDCRALKKNALAAFDRVDGALQFRIADLSTPRGRGLADRHHVGKVTLLSFDGQGEYLSTYTGVMSVDSLTRVFGAIAVPES